MPFSFIQPLNVKLSKDNFNGQKTDVLWNTMNLRHIYIHKQRVNLNVQRDRKRKELFPLSLSY
jgi:hypothetical protein